MQVFHSSEMRWGIRSDASAAHETSDICMEEINRCQRESAGINFILILGNKYGFRPFPARIACDEYDTMLNVFSVEEKVSTKNAGWALASRVH